MRKTMIRFTFASETRILRKTDIIGIEVWRRKVSKKIFGAKKIEES